ncbi:MAG: 30S ribosomal protein S6 [Candidatus Riflebacteria bacterium]|nr:30S ribosomal protein S6 [Candidatus Riflebacteria bacterium]
METQDKRPQRPPTQYETLLITEPSFEKEQIDQFLEKYSTTIQKHGGKIVKTTEWGKRKLAYEIDKHNEGYYILVEFEGIGDLVKKCETYLNLQPSIIRHMTIKKPANSKSQPPPS